MSFLSSSQEILIIDTEKNPIPSVSAFNLAKTKSVLSNNDGLINLSRFLSDDTITFQHPGYKLFNIQKDDISDFIMLELEYNTLENVEVYETRNSDNIRNVAEKKIYITKSEINETIGVTTADILEKGGGVSVQKSQMGGGSPNIRGFEANKVLLMLDGVRLNNAIYRSGHLQNIITIDEYMLEDIEIIFGPSSVLYGSDALGGTIHMKTKEIYFLEKPSWRGSVLSNYNSSYNGYKNNISLVFESTKYSAATSVSFKSFGDIQMGSWRPHGYEDWGLVHHYIDDTNNIICNPNPETQKNTGYTQYDLFNKMIFKIRDNARITSNIQYSNSSDIPRFDKLNDGDIACSIDSSQNCYSSDNLKFHSYYYGPQKRFFSSLKFDVLGYTFDKSEFILSYQNIQESRHKWYLNDYLDYTITPDDYDGFIRQYEKVDIYGFNANIKKDDFYFGSEIIYNNVNSLSDDNNEPLWGIEDTRYPPNGSSLFSAALYGNFLKRLSHKFQLDAGIRYTFSHIMGAYPDSLRRSILDLDGLVVSSKSNILSGNIKLIYYPSDNWKLSSVTSRGFHAPNVDDMLKVFIKGDNITLPNVDLKPEYSLAQEFSVSATLSNQISLYGVAFYTQLTNAITKDSLKIIHSLPGGDELVQQMISYDENYYHAFANQNSHEKINIYGLTIGLRANIAGFDLNSDFNVTNGIHQNLNSGSIAHIPPAFGKIEIRKRINKLKLKLLCLYSGIKKMESYDDAGVDNLDETPNIGMVNESVIWAGLPSWWTLNGSIQYSFSKHLTTIIGIDNIFDAHYKTFGSGVSAPGRSFIFSTKYIF